ncbi:MAG: LTA synthase family protein [Selenomonadaceae bacterium]|nr:LTA synthase family protein [Selenomonadaceae bacterium]
MRREIFLTVMLLTYIVIQLILRASIVVTSNDLLDSQSLLPTFALGLAFDLVAGLFFIAPVALLSLTKSRRLILSATFAFDFIIIIIAVAQFLFWQEFHTNFNFIAVDYLIYTHEMLGNIAQSYNVPLLLIAATLAAVAVFNLQKIFLKPFRSIDLKGKLSGAAAIITVPLVLALIVQSDWREKISDNRHNVELTGNGAYEFVRAFFANELDYQTFYVTRDNADVIQRLRSLLTADNATFLNDEDITRRIDNRNELTAVKPNVIMITVESLNADFTGAFGNGDLTPRLDEIAARSFCFGRMYATGTRTVRGLEALSLSLPPTPGQSILRRKDNADMATLGSIFRAEGYATDFLYGGYGYFDNMNEFFGGNGYEIKDRTTIPDDEIFHETIWGVADEILFSQVLRSMDDHFERGERAFEMVMTTSNHRPFQFPEGRIDMEEGTRPAAVRYTDWAIGDFIERASSRPWFDETVFVIVADHQALAAGKTTLPVNCYHIPCMIYAPKLIASGRSDRLISQMDLPPTLLGMLGVSYESKFMGRDIFRADRSMAFISTYQMLGLIEGDTLIVLTPDKKIAAYRIDDWGSSEYTAIESSAEQIADAVAYYQGASYLYKSGRLKLFNGG